MGALPPILKPRPQQHTPETTHTMNPPDPPSADPAATFTCSGAPNSSVKAVLAEVSLPPTMWRNNEDGTIKNVECEGWIRYAGDRVNGEVLTNETSQ